MQPGHFPRIFLLFLLGAGSLLVSLHAGAPSTSAAPLTRTFGPVVRTGAQLSGLVTAPVDELFAYAFKQGVWAQIPFQVDEVRSTGRRVAEEDNLFDANDELVFMAADAGEDAGEARPITGGVPISESYYRVEVTDPVNPDARGWVYVVRSATLTPSFTGDYVSFTAATKRITGATYQFGYSDSPWFDYLALGTGADILDRTPKIRACLNVLCITEQYPNLLGQQVFIKDGPIRVVLESTGTAVTTELLAYRSLTAWVVSINAPIEATNIRYTEDHNAAAAGSTFYNSTTPPDGAPVDGTQDVFPLQPVSPWWQLSTDQGTIINTSTPAAAGGDQSSVMFDSTSDEALPTGEAGRYAEAGIRIVDPNLSFTYRYDVYYLAGRLHNSGATYQQYFDQPLAATSTLIGSPGTGTSYKIFIPPVTR